MPRKEEDLDRLYLHSIIGYDPDTGYLIWLINRLSRAGLAKVGAIAGTVDSHGHRYITIDGTRYLAHRLAWFHYYGTWPVGELDHKNMDGDDNMISNLRDTGLNRGLQRANQKVRADSQTGLKGVRVTRNNKYVARLAGKHLGTFSSAEEAHAVYVVEAKKLFGEFARAA